MLESLCFHTEITMLVRLCDTRKIFHFSSMGEERLNCRSQILSKQSQVAKAGVGRSRVSTPFSTLLQLPSGQHKYVRQASAGERAQILPLYPLRQNPADGGPSPGCFICWQCWVLSQFLGCLHPSTFFIILLSSFSFIPATVCSLRPDASTMFSTTFGKISFSVMKKSTYIL